MTTLLIPNSKKNHTLTKEQELLFFANDFQKESSTWGNKGQYSSFKFKYNQLEFSIISDEYDTEFLIVNTDTGECYTFNVTHFEQMLKHLLKLKDGLPKSK